MKKSTILFAAMACLAMGFTSCQKEDNTHMRFTGTVDAGDNSKYYFMPQENGGIGGMTWNGYDNGPAPDLADYYANYILSEGLFLSNVASTSWFDSIVHWGNYAGTYLLDADNSDYLNATFEYGHPSSRRAGREFLTTDPGPFWATAGAYGTNESSFGRDNDGLYMRVNLTDEYLDVYRDATTDSVYGYPDIEMVGYSSSDNPANLRFKSPFGILKVRFTLPFACRFSKVEIYNQEGYNTPLTGDIKVRFDNQGNPVTSWLDPDDVDDLSMSASSTAASLASDKITIGIPLLPGTYEHLDFDFTFQYFTATEHTVTKSMNNTASFTIERGKVHNLNLDLTGDFPTYTK